MTRRTGAILVALLALVPLARIIATYPVFSQTVDEPVHVAGGFDWLTAPRYDYDPEHPPLARAFFALDAWLHGARIPAEIGIRGNALLYRQDHYIRNLAGARAGNLPFFLAALAAVGLWARRLFGEAAALVAMALFGALPPILAHSGLATTDMGPTAFTALSLYALTLWLDAATWPRTLALGLIIGLGLLTKFSFVVYFPLAALALLYVRLRGLQRPRAGRLVALPAIVLLIVWAGYKFDIGILDAAREKTFPPIADEHIAAAYEHTPGYGWVRPDLITRFHEYCAEAESHGRRGIDFPDWAKAAGYPSPLAGRHGHDAMAGLPPPPRPNALLEPFRMAWHGIGAHVPLPAPYFLAGLEYVHWHSSVGHPAFLLGQRSAGGWWYYFPVVWFFKTPLAFVLLTLGGLAWLLRHAPNREAAGVALVPLLLFVPAMLSGINIGIRHLLPVYPFLAVLAAAALVQLWRRRRAAAIVLALAFLAETTLAHPDYLAWFNVAAGNHPERIANDSNLDWGQDLLRLANVANGEHLAPLYLGYFGSAKPRRHIAHFEALRPNTPVHGWVAISEMTLALNGDEFAWLAPYQPVRKIGKSIWLYRIP